MRLAAGLLIGVGLIAIAASSPAKAITVSATCPACTTYDPGDFDFYNTTIAGTGSFFFQFMVSAPGTLTFIDGQANPGFAETLLTGVSFTNFSGGPAPGTVGSTPNIVNSNQATTHTDDSFAGSWSGLAPGYVYQLLVSYAVTSVGGSTFDPFSGSLSFAGPVPLPAPLVLLGTALIGAGLFSRRKKNPTT